jgi:hypothetical protein
MADPAQFSLLAAAQNQKAQPFLRPLFRIEAIFTALVVAGFGFLPLVVAVGCTLAAFWWGHQLVMVHYEGAEWWRYMLWDMGKMMLYTTVALFYWRQLLSPPKDERAWLEVTAAEQPHFFDALKLVCHLVRAPVPTRLRLDASSKIRADYRNQASAFIGRGLYLRLGLCLPVGLRADELLGLVAHELSFYSKGAGSGWNRLTRGVVMQLSSRAETDEWTLWLWEAAKTGRLLLRPLWLCLCAVSHGCTLSLRLLAWVCQIMAESILRRSVEAADACSARVVGAEVYAAALIKKAQLHGLHQRAEWQLRKGHVAARLPDSMPLLVARLAQQKEQLQDSISELAHWAGAAAGTTSDRIAIVMRSAATPLLQGTGAAPMLFHAYYDLARRSTYFRYLNEWKLEVTAHQLVSAEEILHEQRFSRSLVESANRYLMGMAHPERAFCGMTEEHALQTESDALQLELEDARSWLKSHLERMNTALAEWSSSWRMVRDLEMGLQLVKAGLPVAMHQYSLRGTGAEAFQTELEHRRHVMDAFEGVLRQYEAKAETRMACALELLWRAPTAALSDKLKELRQTLPHWVLLYEALGLHLPIMRELITMHHAHLGLGAGAAGVIQSAQYSAALSDTLPRLISLACEITHSLQAWPYPFAQAEQKTHTLSNELLSHAELDLLTHFMTEQAVTHTQAEAQLVEQAITKLIDSYFSLYHQAYARVTKAAEMSEWQLCPPLDLLNHSKPTPKLTHRLGPILGRSTHDPEVELAALSA